MQQCVGVHITDEGAKGGAWPALLLLLPHPRRDVSPVVLHKERLRISSPAGPTDPQGAMVCHAVQEKVPPVAEIRVPLQLPAHAGDPAAKSRRILAR